MTTLLTTSRHLLAIAVIAMLGFATLGATAVAQDDETVTADEVITHPAHVHNGTCAELDPNPAYPLDNVGPRLTDDEELPASEDIKGSLTANAVEYSQTEIDVNLEDLLTEAHALNVHESDQNVGNYIACGDIGGPLLDDKLYIGLMAQNDSGYVGIATFEKKDDDKTEVTVYLFNTVPVEGQATPEA
jgi:hypothetical protein